MARRLVITLDHNLPARPRALSSEDLSRVFGGCRDNWATCTNYSQCCELRCQTSLLAPPGYKICLPPDQGHPAF
jgi:hypothetical protein